jgi:hypothetical protein
MDKLHYIVQHLDTEDFNSLEIFLQRNRYRKDRKDIELLSLLRTMDKLPQQNALKKLYDGKNEVVAYHALRKRLLSSVLDFFTLKSVDQQKGHQQYSSEGLLNLSKFFFDEGASNEGLIYLKKVIQQEEHNPNTELRMKAYLLWLENWFKIECEETYEQVLERYSASEKELQDWNRLKILTSSVKRSIFQSKSIGLDFDIQRIIKQIAKEFDLKKSYLNSVEGVWLIAKSLDLDAAADDELAQVYSWLFSRCKKKITAEEIEYTSASRLLEIYLILGDIALKLGKTKAIDFIQNQSEILLPYVNKIQAESFKNDWLLQEWFYVLNFERKSIEFFTEKLLQKVSEDELSFTIPRILFCWMKAGSIGVKAFIENGKHKSSWYLSRITEEERVMFISAYFVANQSLLRPMILVNRILKWSGLYLNGDIQKEIDSLFSKYKKEGGSAMDSLEKSIAGVLGSKWSPALEILFKGNLITRKT